MKAAILALLFCVSIAPLFLACAGSGGIHARMAYSEEGGLRVVDVPPGPAEDAGLLLDDRIASIDGESVRGMNMLDIVERLRGRVGSEVEIEVIRNGEYRVLVVERAAYER